ncbi:MAG: LacI family DNA-binding transcriptional regulator [Anaerolineales bacterium]|nr:LacI family DNA-binding transcriptional regulator [Anaerolineales bacterium]
MTVTIRDVAKKANVGIATVSRVLNDNPAVSPSTREKVLKAIEDLDYTPNPTAQRLSLGRTHTISVILPFLTIPSFVERLRGVQHAMADCGLDCEYDLVLYGADTSERIDYLFSILPRKSRTDGILILSLRPDEIQVQRMLQSDVPIILVDVTYPKFSSVYVDNFKGGMMATQYLLGLGHHKIAFLSDYLKNVFRFSAMKDRFDGYCQALKDAGIEFNPAYHRQVPHDREQAREVAKEWLAGEHRPTAIFASSDMQAIGALFAARELGLRVPEDLSIIGFDDIRDAELVGLTTIRQPLFESGYTGAMMLLDRLRTGNKETKTVLQEIELVERKTTAPIS